jgi:metal-responsive CopG/Arc/MetJ family transcriptional regulator
MVDKYATVRIPKELADEIDCQMKKQKRGYTSRAEFIKEAVREKIERITRSSTE